MASKMSFGEWMNKVNDAVETKVGLSMLDLPDMNYADMYESGVGAKRAANKAVKNAGE